MVVKWRILFSNGETFGHEDGRPCDAPLYGVVAVVQQLDDEVRCQVIHSADIYWVCNDMWWGGDLLGFLDQAANLGAMWPKQGRMIRFAAYGDILGAAMELSHEWDQERER